MNLKEFSLSHKSKKELSDLKEIPVSIEIREGEFTDKETKQPIKYNFIEIDGYQYSLKAKDIQAIKTILSARPQTTKIQFIKTDNGNQCIPLD